MKSTETTTSASFDKSMKSLFKNNTSIDESRSIRKTTIKDYIVLNPEDTKLYKSKRVKARTVILKWK